MTDSSRKYETSAHTSLAYCYLCRVPPGRDLSSYTVIVTSAILSFIPNKNPGAEQVHNGRHHKVVQEEPPEKKLHNRRQSALSLPCVVTTAHENTGTRDVRTRLFKDLHKPNSLASGAKSGRVRRQPCNGSSQFVRSTQAPEGIKIRPLVVQFGVFVKVSCCHARCPLDEKILYLKNSHTLYRYDQAKACSL